MTKKKRSGNYLYETALEERVEFLLRLRENLSEGRSVRAGICEVIACPMVRVQTWAS